MNTMKKIVANILLLGMASTQPAFASLNKEGSYSLSAILNVVLLMCAVICLIWSLKILSLVRGGLMSRSWQMFTIGFCFLTLAQLIIIGEKANLFFVPGYVTTALYVLMVTTWLIGVYQTRKALG